MIGLINKLFCAERGTVPEAQASFRDQIARDLAAELANERHAHKILVDAVELYKQRKQKTRPLTDALSDTTHKILRLELEQRKSQPHLTPSSKE